MDPQSHTPSCPYLYGDVIYVLGFDRIRHTFVLVTVYPAPPQLIHELNRQRLKSSSTKYHFNN